MLIRLHDAQSGAEILVEAMNILKAQTEGTNVRIETVSHDLIYVSESLIQIFDYSRGMY